jgi:16S rRNA (guanine527-N7)-methyltransferase
MTGVLTDVSRETTDRLDALVQMVMRWNRSLNLVASGTLTDLRRRHIDDSTQIVRYIGPETTRWVDLGSGGGFPGLVVAAILHETRPDCRVVLVESDKRKAVFLHEAARKMGVEADVLVDRIESVPPLAAQTVSARALAPLSALCSLARRHLQPGGTALFMKGARYTGELDDARAAGWRFDLVIHPSTTDPAAAILEMRNIRNGF